MRISISIFCACICLLSAPSFAYLFEDNASATDYSDGLDVGDLGLTTSCGYLDRWETGSATIVASPSGLLDTSGVSFRTDTSVLRTFAPPPPMPLTIVQVDLEAAALPSGTSVSFSIGGDHPVNGAGGLSVAAVALFPTWHISVNGTTMLSTIPATDPIRVQVVMDESSSYTATLIPLLGGSPFVQSGTYGNSLTSVDIDTLTFGGMPTAELHFNSLIIDNTAS
jgi:hypothetical protein